MSRLRIFPETPWLLAGIATMAVITGGVARPCWAQERPVIENSIGMKLVSIPAGEFLMGGTEEEVAEQITYWRKALERAGEKANDSSHAWMRPLLEKLESEKPQHRVVLTKSFFLGKYAVTQKEFSTIMGFNPSRFAANARDKKGRELAAGLDTSRYPVECVKWEDAVEFCRQLSSQPEEVAAGRIYRLPTEAEWEYACRAGTTARYYWGDTSKPDDSDVVSCAWLRSNSGGHPHPVGQKRPNPWGLFDMIGNVSQWCADWYDPHGYVASPSRDPLGPASGTERVHRGGGHYLGSNIARAGARIALAPTIGFGGLGFRVACDVSTPPPPVETKPQPPAMKDAETRLREKGLTRRMGYFLLPEESQFIRYCTTIERLRVACFHAQKECQDAQRQLSRVQSAKAGAIQSRMQARNYMAYSDTWREHWAAVRARNQATDAMMLVDLSKEGVEKWQQDVQADYDSAVELFAQQCHKLREMFNTMRKQYSALAEDSVVKRTLADLNREGKGTYRLGPTPTALSSVKKLEHEEGVLTQFKKN